MHKMCIFFQYRYGLESIIYVHVGIPRSTLIVGSWAEFCLARQSNPESDEDENDGVSKSWRRQGEG